MKSVCHNIRPQAEFREMPTQLAGISVESLTKNQQYAWAAIQALQKELEDGEDIQEERLPQYQEDLEALHLQTKEDQRKKNKEITDALEA